MVLAREALLAARDCQRKGSARACANRAYYAAFSTATAHLLWHGERPRAAFGTWRHENLGAVLETVMRRSRRRHTEVAEAVRCLKSLYAMRVDADYNPAAVVDIDTAKFAVRRGESFVRVVWPDEDWR